MIDCDVHNNWSSADVLLPYLPRAFREYVERGELPGGRGSFPAAHRPWLHPEDFKRSDATPPGGGAAGSDHAFMCEQLLDRYDPICEACAALELPFAVHLGGNAGVNAPPTGCGPPTFFWEAHALLCETGMGHVASTIAHGVFERWPGARLVLIECGIAWLPAILWRLDEDYRALRKETPWLRRLPSEYAHDHIRLTTQPLELPRNPAALWPALDDIGARDMLMFASDYPHWDFDDPVLVRLPPTAGRTFVYGREGEILRCSRHGWEFEIATGRACARARIPSASRMVRSS